MSVSVAFTDNAVRQQFEASTIDTEKRIEALKTMNKAGIRTSALICPVIPYISDVVALIDQLEAYTNTIWIYGLSIRDKVDRNWHNVEQILRQVSPELKEKIETTVFDKKDNYWEHLRSELQRIKKQRGLTLNIHL